MREDNMTQEWRTVQIFLEPSNLNIYEVEIDKENATKIRCNCRTFSSSKSCKHSHFVKKSMERNNGHYAIQIPADIPDELATESMEDAKLFRDFIIKYAKIEVVY